MKSRVVFIAMIVAMCLAVGTNGPLAISSEETTVEQIMHQYVDAYNKKDLATFEKICDPNVLFIEEGKKTMGWLDFRDNLKSEWGSIAEGYWDVVKIQVHFADKNFAWTTDEGSFKGKMKDGTQVQESLIESCIFQKKSGAWKLVLTHLSAVPSQK